MTYPGILIGGKIRESTLFEIKSDIQSAITPCPIDYVTRSHRVNSGSATTDRHTNKESGTDWNSFESVRILIVPINQEKRNTLTKLLINKHVYWFPKS